MTGKLFVVPTPIGNLKDITLRAIETLQSVDVILAEDTRTSGKLLNNYEITTPMESYHKFNEHKRLSQIITNIQEQEYSYALITDAGTPGISDPGFLLIRDCIKHNIPVETLPGATALIPALVNSGLPSDKFVFEGFLPQKKGRQSRLKSLANEQRTLIFYESPYRLVKLLGELESFFGDRQVAISRELSKIYEENIHGTLSELQHTLKKRNSIKGELVIVVAGVGYEKKN